MTDRMQVPRVNTNDNTVEIVHWYVKDKEFVEKNQELVDIESSKAVVTIESESSGFVLTNGKVGEIIQVGETLVSFYSELSDLEAAIVGETSTQSEAIVLESAVDSHLVDNGQTHENVDLLSPKLLSQKTTEIEGKVPCKTDFDFSFTRFSPAAEEYIEQHGIDAKHFEGMGLVSVDIIETCLGIKAPVKSELNLSEHKPEASHSSSLRTKKVSKSKHLEISLLTAGQAGRINSSLTVQFDSEGIRETLEEMGSLNGQILPIILFEFSRLLEQYPAFTAYYWAEQIHFYDRIDIGLAIDLGNGLKVPVIRGANLLSPVDLLDTITRYASQYLDNQLSVPDLSNSTVTVTDLSGESILHFQPLLNQQQSIILGIGGDSSIAGWPMSLTIVFDHRVLAGREVSLFLNTLKKNLLSYALNNLPQANKLAKGKTIQCNRCLIDLTSLYKKFTRDALMHVYVSEQGETAYICHTCMGGY